MDVPFWTGFGTERCVRVYAEEPKSRDRQMAVMKRTPARDRFFIFVLSCPAVASEAGTGSMPVRQIGTKSGASWPVVRRPSALQCGTSMRHVNCAQDCEAVK